MLKLYPGKGIFYIIIAAFFPCTVFAQPVINAVTPAYGPVNTTVTITGSNFNTTPAGNIVWFGSVQVPVTAASTGSLTVTVPTGVSYQPITVTSSGLTSAPVAPFITTFSDPGQFTSTAFSTRKDIPTGSGPQFICNMDLDGDGKPDLIVADGDSNVVDVYRNTSTPGAISFVEVASYVMGSDDYPIGVVAGDLDGDGKPEIVVSNYNSQNLSIFLNTSTPGNISMAPAINYPSGNYAVGASIADLNGDGKPEVIVACQGGNSFSVYTNSSTIGHISFSNETSFNAPSGGSPFRVIVADLDGDGKPDMAAANSYNGTVSVYLNTTPTGSGTISFAPHADFTTGNFPEGLAIGDLDGDGLPDLAVANNTDNTLSLLRNTSTPGNLSFATQITVPSGNSVYDLVISDLDGDGKPDLAVDDQYGSTVSVHRNTSTPGTISVSANIDYPVGNIPYSITAADFDGDGKPDLATANDGGQTFTVLRNKGSNEPSISSFMPTVGTTGTVVTITGVNFTGATSISFGDTAATSFTVVSPTTITATVGAGASGAVSLVAPAGAASLAGFIYSTPPVIKNVSPDSATNGTLVTITGKGFTTADTVTFGGTPALSFTVQNDSTIFALVGAGSSGAVAVSTPVGDTSLAGFIYLNTQIPPVELTGFLPDTATQGATITISGENLSGVTSISLGGTPVQSFRIFSDSVIYVTVGAGSTGTLVVSGNNGTDSLTGFVYIQPAPPPPVQIVNITGFSPASGSTGTTITITGTQLTGVSSVSFGGTPALSFTVISDSLILAVVGSGSTGYVSVANTSSADSLPGFIYTYDSTRLTDTAAVFQLLSFSGIYSAGNPILQWQTANDGIIAYYALERSTDGSQFAVIATVMPDTSDSVTHIYSFSDAGHNPGLNYYRLRMQDSTATYNYSATIAVQPPGKSSLLVLYPNPVIYGFTYVTLPDYNSNSTFQLLDMSGKAIKIQPVQAGIPQVRVDMSGVIPGVYGLIWSNGTKSAYQIVLVLSK